MAATLSRFYTDVSFHFKVKLNTKGGVAVNHGVLFGT